MFNGNQIRPGVVAHQRQRQWADNVARDCSVEFEEILARVGNGQKRVFRGALIERAARYKAAGPEDDGGAAR